MAIGDVKENVQLDPAYKLVWEDDFEGTELNRSDWNVELHEPGWVNAEWQEYVDSKENIYVKDGNLILQPIKTVDKDGNAYYTSGRVNTQNKHDFLYGRFEARLKVPTGKGFLPAFWMMPTDEDFYGQWPKCGEIDIMEVMGDDITRNYSTLHFGEPHAQRQNTYVLEKGDFANEFHVYACEWEPGEIRFYLDGKLFYTENRWFSQKGTSGKRPYPAPFNQPFYMILNVAVGGSWVGYPDENTGFGENAQMVVDYVRVFQKDLYNEDVTDPDTKLEFREPDASGNYIVNGDFCKLDDIGDNANWKLLIARGGKGSADIEDGEIHIETANPGNFVYSIQLVQSNLPLKQGSNYRLSFDAYAEEERTMITNISSCDLNYCRYMNDEEVRLTMTKTHYSYEFYMAAASDLNCRVEFNLGNQDSTAMVHIANVKLEEKEKNDAVRIF